MASESNIQSEFLDQIRQRLPLNLSFVDELAEALSISRDSAYRRIRGETVLSLEELKSLYTHFGVSIDELFASSSQMVTFHRRVVTPGDYDLAKWMNSILKNLDFLTTFESNEMIFSAKDIPIFHYFRLPELSAFKIFFWMKTLVGYPDFENKNYREEHVPKELVGLGSRIWTCYSSLPSTEIWHEEVLYDTLRQIEFYHECSFFEDPNQAAFLCDKLLELIEQINLEAAVGRKSEGGEFNLYNNAILIADNTVFARMGDRRCVYVNHNSFNLLLTFQEPFCSQTEDYLRNLTKKSTLISKTAERERNIFFNNMKKRIREFREKVK